MNDDALIDDAPLSISVPPNHSTMAMAVVPRNSLIGWASACRRATLLLRV